MPRYSIIVTITRDIVVDADDEDQATEKAKSYVAAEVESMDDPEFSDPAETDPDYDSYTSDAV